MSRRASLSPPAHGGPPKSHLCHASDVASIVAPPPIKWHLSPSLSLSLSRSPSRTHCWQSGPMWLSARLGSGNIGRYFRVKPADSNLKRLLQIHPPRLDAITTLCSRIASDTPAHHRPTPASNYQHSPFIHPSIPHSLQCPPPTLKGVLQKGRFPSRQPFDCPRRVRAAGWTC